ncbi:alpha/beta hydrolase [Nocardiopsis alborubida]|uniref:Alpha/beta hydrolase n=1 Tax=Nocardiopsis alborubida TaxID=146802 RepID=A0A7X6MIK0_9ACTN|nr:alpha/beta hydrolase [Nocardiopsis alborubida]NKZ01195.1 alpha/beta hydrolase [Nocardiopsis alborubida]
MAVVLVAACSPPADDPFLGQDVVWRPCHGSAETAEPADGNSDPSAQGAPPTARGTEPATRATGPADREPDAEWLESLECGTVTVPLDHDEPGGRTLDIALVRAPASGPPEERLGSLVVNPGGPGASGVRALGSPPFGDDVRAAFDLVSFDPRGVGGSGGFACGDRYALVEARQDVAGTDPGDLGAAELQPLEDAARRYARACTETVGEEFLTRLGTAHVARDLDIVRDALGEERLNFVGHSYGAHLGALYTHLYPDRVRAVVLDGAVATGTSNARAAVDQVAALQSTWNTFVAHCAQDAACPFAGADRAPGSGGSGTLSEADARAAALLRGLDRAPAEAEGIPVDGRTLMTMVVMELSREDGWDLLTDLFTALAEDDAEGTGRHLGRLYDRTFGAYARAGSGEVVPGTEHQDASAVFTAVNCADRVDPVTVQAYRDAADEAADLAPLFGPDPVWDHLPCAYWPRTEEAPAATAPDAPPVVVVGAVGDPATPYSWAEDLAERMETATLVTYEGAGHTVYGTGRSPCVDDAVDAYLLTGEVPEPGLTCPGAPD